MGLSGFGISGKIVGRSLSPGCGVGRGIRDYASPSAFMRVAVERELRGVDATLDESASQHRTAGVGKFRYSRFLKTVGANMVGDVHAALSELANRIPEQ